MGAVSWRTPALRRSVVSSVTCWEVSVRFATIRLIGPAPKRRGEIETRSGEIDPVTMMRVGGRGSFGRCSVVPQAAAVRPSAAAMAITAARRVAPRMLVAFLRAARTDGARSLLDARVSPGARRRSPRGGAGDGPRTRPRRPRTRGPRARGGRPGTAPRLPPRPGDGRCPVGGRSRSFVPPLRRGTRPTLLRFTVELWGLRLHAVRRGAYICSRGPRSPARDRGVPVRRHRDQRPRGRRVRADGGRGGPRRRRRAARPLGAPRPRTRAALPRHPAV